MNYGEAAFELAADTLDIKEYEKDWDRISLVFKALSDPNRLKIMYLLSGGERCVSDLLPFFDIQQPTVSIHLLQLEDIGLLKVQKDGRKRLYSLVDDDLLQYINRLSQSMK
jgi:ArsR family transcriptional regulator